jgi:hypothetical protein
MGYFWLEDVPSASWHEGLGWHNDASDFSSDCILEDDDETSSPTTSVALTSAVRKGVSASAAAAAATRISEITSAITSKPHSAAIPHAHGRSFLIHLKGQNGESTVACA